MPKETLPIQQLFNYLKKKKEVIKFSSLHSNVLRHHTQVTNNH